MLKFKFNYLHNTLAIHQEGESGDNSLTKSILRVILIVKDLNSLLDTLLSRSTKTKLELSINKLMLPLGLLILGKTYPNKHR